jgi:hypothetical protein
MAITNLKLVPGTTGRPQAGSLFALRLNGYRGLTLRSIKQQRLDLIIRFLGYQKGDSALTQDAKTLVIRRLACEAYTSSREADSQRLEALLTAFPPVPLINGYSLWPKHSLGKGSKYMEKCRPAAGDTPVVLRAKREALIGNLMQMVKDNFDLYQGVAYPHLKKEAFVKVLSWTWDILREHQPLMPAALAELVQVHILDPEVPFNLSFGRRA